MRRTAAVRSGSIAPAIHGYFRQEDGSPIVFSPWKKKQILLIFHRLNLLLYKGGFLRRRQGVRAPGSREEPEGSGKRRK